MYRREALSLIASTPLLSLPSITSTPEVIHLNFPNQGAGSVRGLSEGEVVLDKSISDRAIWRIYVDYYASALSIPVPDFDGFRLHKFLYHENEYRSLGYNRSGYILNIVLGKNKSILYSIKEKEDVFVMRASDTGGVIKATEYHLNEVDFR